MISEWRGTADAVGGFERLELSRIDLSLAGTTHREGGLLRSNDFQPSSAVAGTGPCEGGLN